MDLSSWNGLKPPPDELGEAMIKFILMVNKQGQTRLVCRLRLFAVAYGEPTAN